MAFIQKFHLHHHYSEWNANFGNTTAIWDKLLGTYSGDYKSFQIEKRMNAHFVKKSTFSQGEL